MSNHTPGPWEAHFWDILDNRTLEPTGKKRMDIQYRIFPDVKVGRTLATLDFENEANAHLIAAAPDLLEALKALVDFAPSDGHRCLYCDARVYAVDSTDEHSPDCELIKAQTAIAKAEGKEGQHA